MYHGNSVCNDKLASSSLYHFHNGFRFIEIVEQRYVYVLCIWDSIGLVSFIQQYINELICPW